MSWAKQSEEMLKGWTEAQQTMWKNWTDMFSATPQTNEMWNQDLWTKSIEMWEQVMDNSVSTQDEWLRMWVDSLESQDQLPDEVIKWAEQVQAMMGEWNASQAKLWNNWFSMLKGMQPATNAINANDWIEESQKTFQAWQNSAQQVMDANMKAAQLWTGVIAGQGK
ncbi:MAG: hypothetical protein H6642_09225 [Caldilineaceae bacterium]|nr:hypothetical protein [Caldilineaceae bacterium]